MTGPGVLRAGANPRYRRLLASFAVSATGDWLYVIALTVWVFQRTGSPAWVAATSIVRLLPFVVLGSVGGAAVDRFGARRVMVVADVARALTMLGLVAVIASGGPVALGLALAATTTALSTAARPGAASLTPRLVGADDLASANAAAEAIQNLALMLGPAIGGLLLARTSATVAVTVTAVAFALSAVLVARVRVDPAAQSSAGRDAAVHPTDGHVSGVRPPEGHSTEGHSTEGHSTGGPSTEGHPSGVQDPAGGSVREVLRSPILVALFAITFAIGYQWGNENVLYVLLGDRLGTGPNGLGYFLAAIGLGGLVAAAMPHRVLDGPRPGLVVLVAALAVGLPMFLASFLDDVRPVYVLLLADGVGCIVVQVVTATLMQRTTPQHLLGRVFGAHLAVLYGGTLLGSTVAAAVVDRLGVLGGMRLTGLLVPLTALAVSPVLAAAGRTAQQRRAALADRVALLERLRILDGAAPGVIDEIAAGMTAEPVTAGTVLIREGDPADDFFVVRAGTFAVTARAAGAELPAMGPGDYFGEIGLLEGRPRTATVTARTDGEVYRVAGDDFVRAVTLGPSLSASLRLGIDLRLSRTPSPRAVAPTS